MWECFDHIDHGLTGSPGMDQATIFSNGTATKAWLRATSHMSQEP
jgi:hypothetical protein